MYNCQVFPALIFQRNIPNRMELHLIKQKIHDLRGQRILLDFYLADLYEVPTKVLKQAVRRNLERFPEDFMFALTQEEYRSLRSQIVTLESGRGKFSKYVPFAFTEHGVAMLSGVLHSWAKKITPAPRRFPPCKAKRRRRSNGKTGRVSGLTKTRTMRLNASSKALR